MAEPIDKLSPHSTYTEYIASLLGFLIRPVDYPHYICPVQPGRIALLGYPHSHKQSKDSSTANFEATSSSLSLSKAELLKQHGQDQVDNQGHSTEGLPLPVMSPEDFLTNANMKLLRTKDQQFSWIGSEEDREDRPEGIVHAVSLSKMIHQNQADNFQHVNRNRLPMTKFDRPKYPDSVGFNTPGLITLDSVSKGRSSSIDQTHVMSSLTQMTSYIPASSAG